MEIFKEAQTAVNFASYYPLLHKATADNETPCPGYVYEEIIKLSYVSVGHRTHLVDFLLSRLQVSGCCGKQKVVNVLRHLTQKAHPATRNLLRSKDTQLRAVGGSSHALHSDPSLGGLQSSPLHQPSNTSSYMVVNAKTPQLLLHSAVQELLAELFDPQLIRADEEKIRLGDCHPSLSSLSAQPGMGSSVASGPSSVAGGVSTKYQGFGSSAFSTSPTVINKVRGLVDRILWPDVKELSPTAKAILKPDHGTYVPFEIPTEYLSELTPCFNSAGGGGIYGGGGGGLSSSVYSSAGAHRGVAGSASSFRGDPDGRASAMERSAVSGQHLGPATVSRGGGGSVYGGGSGSSLRGNSPRVVKGRVRSAITSKSTTDGRASQRTFLLNLDSDAESTSLPSAHRAGQAGGGWEDEDHLDDEEEEEEGGAGGSSGGSTYSFRERSYSFRDTTSLPPLGALPDSVGPLVGGPQTERLGDNIAHGGNTERSKSGATTRSRSSSTLREAEFLKEFLNVCSTWPVPYDAFMDLCKRCSLLDAKFTLQEIAALFYKEVSSKSSQSNNIDVDEGDGTLDSSVPSQQPPPPPQSTSLPHHHQMALLTLVDLSVHDDVFSPVHVRDVLAPVLELLQKDLKAADVVQTRAKRLALVTDKLAQVCERRGA